MAHPAAAPRILRPSRAVLSAALDAIRRFRLIAPGDRIAVGVSGGKDSLLLLAVLAELSRRGDFDFHFEAVHLDQGQPGFDRAAFSAALAPFDVPLRVLTRDTWSVVSQRLGPEEIPCSLCSRLRRGILHRYCTEVGFTKLALGHHFDDALETFFLNLFYGGRLAPLKPCTPTGDGRLVTIRPLILVEEAKIRAWVHSAGLSPV
ncbi:MAG: tRNA 2-thiocytidine(32) synthetase TtcA, partial [Deltaproteobacteria bacterium]